LNVTENLKSKLLVIELWGMGDLVIATPFLQAASRKYEVTLLAKPYASDLRPRLWPEVKVVPFIAPWTAFVRKYRLHAWPWRELLGLRRLRSEHFATGLSARLGDPRDHWLLWFIGAKRRLGFPRLGSQLFLTDPLMRPAATAHRYECWRSVASKLELQLPPRERIPMPHNQNFKEVLVHTGAGQPVRVWPLEHYRRLVVSLRRSGYEVQLACDPDQLNWWREAGEVRISIPRSVTELLTLVDRAGAFIGNDSGPAHLSALCGVPTFTIFGPQLPEWFAPLHPAGQWLEGKACPYKPCKDYCFFPTPYCMTNIGEEEVLARVTTFLKAVL